MKRSEQEGWSRIAAYVGFAMTAAIGLNIHSSPMTFLCPM